MRRRDRQHRARPGQLRRGSRTSTPSSGWPTPAPAATLPKGLSLQTADLVASPLQEAGELSAAECADVVGISRVSARRCLEHFVARGSASVRLQYDGAGRLERRYRPDA